MLHAFAATALTQLLVLAAGPLLSPAAPGLHDLLRLGASAEGWALLLGLAAGPTLLGFGLFNVALRHLPSAETNLVLTLEPPMTAVIAYALLGERMTAAEIAGGALILGGVALLHLGEGRRAARSPGRAARLLGVHDLERAG